MRKSWILRLKRITALLLCVAMMMSVAGCKKGDSSADKVSMTVVDAEDAIIQLAGVQADFGYENALSELTEKNTTTIDGDCYYRLQQNYQGIPVYGRTVVCATDKKGNVTSLTGNVEDIDVDISLAPSVSAETIITSVTEYIQNELNIQDTPEFLPDSFKNDNLCIYHTTGSEYTCLAYQLYWNGYEFLVDANTGEVVQCLTTIYTEMTSFSIKGYDLELNQQIDDKDQTYYTMVDESRNIRIYNAHGGAFSFDFYNAQGELLAKRENVIKSFSPSEAILYVYSTERLSQPTSASNPPSFDTNAIKLLSHLQSTYDFYKDIFSLDTVSVDGSAVYLNGVYNDNMELAVLSSDNAYCWGYASASLNDMVFSFGTKNSISLDTVAHEYTHAIERRRSNMIYSGESGAIMEALSDIYGELVEEWCTKNNPDWIHSNRRHLKSPLLGLNPEKYGGMMWQDTSSSVDNGGVHNNSTVISHAAYLMWNGIDGTEAKKIDTDDLAKLWYRAMLTMPSDCDFNDCRKVVELAASSMKLTSKQLACVSEAFDAVGITGEFSDTDSETYNVSTDGTLRVFGGNGKAYGNYTLEIWEKKLFGDLRSSGVKRTISVDSAEPYALELNEGRYVLTITDNSNPKATETFTVRVRKNDKNKTIDIYTNFGSTPVRGTVSTIKVENGEATNVPVREAVISVYYEDQKMPVEIIRMNSKKDDFFKVDLPVGIYSFVTEAEGYITSTTTFELTSEKEEYLEIVLEAEFVPEPEVILVTDAYAETEANYTFRIPQINLSVGDVAQINEEIYNTLYPVVEASVNEIAETGYPFTSDEVLYSWSVNEDVLSLVTRNHSWPDASPRYEYMVYNVSVSTGMEMSNTELIETAGLTEAEFYERAKEAIGSAFWDGWDPSNGNFSSQMFLDMFNECLDKSVTDENIGEGFLYMNEQGQLCLIAKQYSFAGPAYTWCDVNLIEYELSPYYEA